MTICVPIRNNPEKNAAMRGLGRDRIEEGRDYDESGEVCARRTREGTTLAHSTNDPRVIAGAATMSLEMLEQSGDRRDGDRGRRRFAGGRRADGARASARRR